MSHLSTAPRAAAGAHEPEYDMIGGFAALPTRVFTIHGTVLYTDPASGELRHGPVGSSPINARLVSHGAHVQIVYEAGGLLQPIICLPDRCQTIESADKGDGSATPTVLEVVRQDWGWVGLKAEGRFLSAEPNGQLTLSRTVCSGWEKFMLSDAPRSREVFDALGLMTPFDIPHLNKKRFGCSGDGGYVLLDDFDDVSAIYSIGIGNQVSFDEELANMGKEIFMFDHTVDGPPVKHANFHFFRQGAGKVNDEAAALYTIEHQIRRLGHEGRSDLVLKIDAESAEFDIFSTMSRETLRHFRQITMEVHGLLNLGDPTFRAKFVAALSRINSVFTLFHVHANNYGNIGFVDGFVVVDVLELSYVRSDLTEREISKTIYPTLVDFPNWPPRPDYLLWFYPFVPVPNEVRSTHKSALLKSIEISNRTLCGDSDEGDDYNRWHALWGESRRLRDLNDEEGFVRTALEAFRRRPHRGEPLLDLSRYYLGKSRPDIAVAYAEAGLALSFPEGDRLGVELQVYETGLREAFTIAANYSKDDACKERGRAICNWLALSREVPANVRGLARYNLRWYTEPAQALMPSLELRSLSIAALDGFKAGNLSILRDKDGFILAARAINYELLESGRYDLHGDASFRSRVLLLNLDGDFAITSAAEVHEPDNMPPPQNHKYLGFEDPRLFLWHDDLWCVCSVCQLNTDGRAEMVLARIDRNCADRFIFTDWRMLASGMPPQWQKNWMPQVVGNDLRFVYSLDPTRVISESGTLVLQETAEIAVENFKGGSQAISFDGGWLMVVHEWELINGRRHYLHRLVWLDENHRLCRLSRRFFFKRVAVEFASGLAWHVDGKRLVISYSVDDREPFLATVDAGDIRAALLDIDTHRRTSEEACAAGHAAWVALKGTQTPAPDRCAPTVKADKQDPDLQEAGSLPTGSAPNRGR